MSDQAPERIWVTPAYKDFKRNPRDKGTASYIGDACDGQAEDDDHEYIRADLVVPQEVLREVFSAMENAHDYVPGAAGEKLDAAIFALLPYIKEAGE